MTRFWYHYINQFSFFKLHTPCPISSSPLPAHSHSTSSLSAPNTYSLLGNTSNALRQSRPEIQGRQRQQNTTSRASDSDLQHKADNSNNHQNSRSNTRIRNSNYRIPTKNIPATTPHQNTEMAKSNLREKDERSSTSNSNIQSLDAWRNTSNPKKAITFITRGPKIKHTEKTTDGLAKKVKTRYAKKASNHLTIKEDKMKTPVNATDVTNRKESEQGI